jgi:hypothetical protein
LFHVRREVHSGPPKKAHGHVLNHGIRNHGPHHVESIPWPQV